MSKAAMGKMRVGLTVCSSCELSTRSKSVCQEAFIHERTEVCAREVDRCCMACRTRANDHLHHQSEYKMSQHSPTEQDNLTTFECRSATPFTVGADVLILIADMMDVVVMTRSFFVLELISVPKRVE